MIDAVKPSIQTLASLHDHAAPAPWAWWMAEDLDQGLADLDAGQPLGASEYALICEMRNALPCLLRLAHAAKEYVEAEGDSTFEKLCTAIDAFDWERHTARAATPRNFTGETGEV